MFLSGYFGRSLADAAAEEGIPMIDVAEKYREYRLAKLFGWTLEYIRSLGLLSAEAFLQIEDAEIAVYNAKRKK